jgi:hypothetical protein
MQKRGQVDFVPWLQIISQIVSINLPGYPCVQHLRTMVAAWAFGVGFHNFFLNKTFKSR